MSRGLGIAHGVYAAAGRASGGGKKTAKVGGPSTSSSSNGNDRGQRRGGGGAVSSSRPRGKPARLPPPPPVDAGVAPAGMRRRVSVKTSTKGESPFADLRGGGALLSPAARKDPARAEQERKRLWERLGASATGSGDTPAGFAHLLDPGAKAAGTAGRGSGRGEDGTRSRGSGRATLRVGYSAHREKFARALRLELEEEMERAKERLETWPTDRIRQEGYALFGLSAMHEGTLQKDAVVRVLVPRGNFGAAVNDDNAVNNSNVSSPAMAPPTPGAVDRTKRTFAMGAELPFHRFAQGDMVTLVEGDEWDGNGKAGIQGVVVERSMHFLKVAVDEDDEARLLDARRLRMDLSANTITHDRALAALVAFSEPGGMPGLVTTPGGKRLSSTAYAPLQRSLIGIPDGNGTLESIACVPPPWGGKDALAKSLAPALKRTDHSTLNPSQAAAVKRAFGRTLSVWQGPPGTGKTRTLMSFIEGAVELARAQGVVGKKSGPVVLACAASNVAVDNILDGLVRDRDGDDVGGKKGGQVPLKVVRLGSPAKVQPWLESHTLGAVAAQTPMGRKAASIREQARGDYSPRGAAARRQASGMERIAAEQVLRDADVVCCTCVGAGDELLEGFTFRVACVDEATQAPEPIALIPLTKAVAGVLVGDQMQLPPTVTSRKAESCGLGVSLFERLERLGLRPDLLDRQYRMHPALAEWPSKAFYGGKVSSNPTPVDRPPALGLPWPSKTTGQYGRIPMAFVEIDGAERRAPDGLSVLNEAEARAAVAVVETLLSASPKDTLVDGMLSVRSPGDIGVIAPYAAQVRRLRELWASSQAFSTYSADDSKSDDSVNVLDPAAVAKAAESRANKELEVHSVDGFQGREKEVIVLCTVRANANGSLGFVSDQRRLNVAVTRAKRGLVVLGNRATLSSDKTWREWIRWVDKRGLSVKASDFL